MNKMQEYLLRAGTDFGIEVNAPFELKLHSGRRFLAEALLPNLGTDKGAIVVQSDDYIRSFADELKTLGYTYSVFGKPLSNEEYDVESYREMFTEWALGGTRRKETQLDEMKLW